MREFDPMISGQQLVLVSTPKFIEELRREKDKMQVCMKNFMREGTKVLSGIEHGSEVRCKLNLDQIDASDDIVHISIPDHVYSINSSFFLSCFGNSVRVLGESLFRKRYIFECDTVLLKNVDDGIARALKTSSVFGCHHCNTIQHKA